MSTCLGFPSSAFSPSLFALFRRRHDRHIDDLAAHRQIARPRYWRLARPGRWLFPGGGASKPIEVQALHAACRSASRRRRPGQTGDGAHSSHRGQFERRVMSAVELCRTAALGEHMADRYRIAPIPDSAGEQIGQAAIVLDLAQQQQAVVR
jgi:hypothetical protein